MAFGEVESKKKVGMLKGTHKGEELKNRHFWRRKLLLSFFIRAIK